MPGSLKWFELAESVEILDLLEWDCPEAVELADWIDSAEFVGLEIPGFGEWQF